MMGATPPEAAHRDLGASEDRSRMARPWRHARDGLIAAAAFGTGLIAGALPSGRFGGLASVSRAGARIAPPATAPSVAGVARRTSRRTSRRVGR